MTIDPFPIAPSVPGAQAVVRLASAVQDELDALDTRLDTLEAQPPGSDGANGGESIIWRDAPATTVTLNQVGDWYTTPVAVELTALAASVDSTGSEIKVDFETRAAGGTAVSAAAQTLTVPTSAFTASRTLTPIALAAGASVRPKVTEIAAGSIALGAHNGTNTGTGTSALIDNPPLPSGAVSGSLILCLFASPQPLTSYTGWTLEADVNIGTTLNFYLLSHYYSGSGDLPDLGIGSSASMSCITARIAGAAAASPIDGTPSEDTDDPGGSTFTAPSYTTTSANTLVMRAVACRTLNTGGIYCDDIVWTSGSPTVARVEHTIRTGASQNNVAIGVAFDVVAGAGTAIAASGGEFRRTDNTAIDTTNAKAAQIIAGIKPGVGAAPKGLIVVGRGLAA